MYMYYQPYSNYIICLKTKCDYNSLRFTLRLFIIYISYLGVALLHDDAGMCHEHGRFDYLWLRILPFCLFMFVYNDNCPNLRGLRLEHKLQRKNLRRA